MNYRRISRMNDLFLGIDIGYGNTKSRSEVFPSGVKKLATKPPIEKRTVEYEGNYYAVGNQKLDIQKSKTENENTMILTLAAIAEEMKKLHLTTSNIRLGVGLPLTRIGKEKTEYLNYMLKNRRIAFKYEEKDYLIYILSVDVFPQGYAGVVDRLNLFDNSTVVVDIGSWTIDILPLIEGQPDIARCKSLPLGTITCMNDINENLRQKFNGEAEEVIVKEIMINGASAIDKEYLEVIQDGLKQYVSDIMNSLRSLKFNPQLTQFVFIGGGASIIKHFLTEDIKKIEIIEDVCINAKGYEAILNHKYKGE